MRTPSTSLNKIDENMFQKKIRCEELHDKI